ncbi:MAG: hypothetical protein NXH87_16830 [Rhodobiaceae bacterium]|nr:hypothetical protein RHODOSMS8_01464 [Rhodobiaceae bacterium]MCR9243047.1 hypothetical protein [Rhodobiaceae bacterium]
MSMRDITVRVLTSPAQVADWTDLPVQAWHDLQETTALIWKAWVSLFPELSFWDPFGAALTLSLFAGLVIWLVKVRPG